MPRLRTDSAIRKSERTKKVKEEIRLRKAKRAATKHCLRNKERLNEEAKNRMSRSQSEMNDKEKKAFKERRKATAKRHYLNSLNAEIEKLFLRKRILNVGGKVNLSLCSNILNYMLVRMSPLSAKWDGGLIVLEKGGSVLGLWAHLKIRRTLLSMTS
ncbi:hypothetical protein BT96DRAFT_950716 [Gymnopus androsaceus JB14]|uniref:Uncharacterized protein n=1 Tax=Gymnopus androsaceus JB14 TaxID=1447944 RepID=A0A6A4GFG5_9AGAR|nr:hypothetical protein BT96DRAFT_950716 [Gymnopus androsaceus JB14]